MPIDADVSRGYGPAGGWGGGGGEGRDSVSRAPVSRYGPDALPATVGPYGYAPGAFPGRARTPADFDPMQDAPPGGFHVDSWQAFSERNPTWGRVGDFVREHVAPAIVPGGGLLKAAGVIGGIDRNAPLSRYATPGPSSEGPAGPAMMPNWNYPPQGGLRATVDPWTGSAPWAGRTLFAPPAAVDPSTGRELPRWGLRQSIPGQDMGNLGVVGRTPRLVV